MWGLVATGGTYIFLGGRALKLIKKGVNITNSTNPLVLTKKITLTVFDCCADTFKFSSSLYWNWRGDCSFGGKSKSSYNRFSSSSHFRDL